MNQMTIKLCSHYLHFIELTEKTDSWRFSQLVLLTCNPLANLWFCPHSPTTKLFCLLPCEICRWRKSWSKKNSQTINQMQQSSFMGTTKQNYPYTAFLLSKQHGIRKKKFYKSLAPFPNWTLCKVWTPAIDIFTM